MTSQLRIVMVTSSYYPVIGGAERQAQLLAEGLVNRGLSVHILTRRYPNLQLLESQKGVTIHRLAVVGDGHNRLSSFSFISGVARCLIAYKDDYDIVHVHQPFSPMTSALLAKLATGKPVCVKITGSGSFGSLHTLRKMPLPRFRRWLMRKVDNFLVLNEETIPELAMFGITCDKTALIVNGVDTEKFIPLHEAQFNKNRNVVSVGRLSPEKGVDILLQAWRELLDSCPEAAMWRLLILGDGAEKEKLQLLQEKLALTEHIEFVGNVKNVATYLQKSSIFVLSSHSEGLPNALLEAMACGVAPVTTAVGTIPEILVHGETGLLSPPGDAHRLAINLKQILTDRNLSQRMGANARQYVINNYSLDAAVERHLAIYQEIL